ncbi:MAG: uroporphyrinogen-III synthase, partial [Nitriliruptoraceae bacterium]
MSGAQHRLEGVRVLVPRAPAQAEELAGRVRELGGEPVVAPVLTIEPGDGTALAAAASELCEGEVALVCLTSPNGVDALADALAQLGGGGRQLARAGMVAAVGPGTAARLEQRLGIGADLVPETATTEALGHAVPPGRG